MMRMGENRHGCCVPKYVPALLATVLALTWMVVIFLFSAQPDTESAQLSGRISYRLVAGWNNLFGLAQTEGELAETAMKIDFPVRKAAHMSEYAILAVLVYAAIALWGKAGGTYRGFCCVRAALLISAAYACTDELHQRFVPGRAGRITDVLIDTAGAAVGLGIVCIAIYFRSKNRKR